MSDPTRGITCPDMRRVIREALDNGWEWGGIGGTTHATIRWPKTGDKIGFGTTPGLASWKTVATNIKKISGVEVWHKGNRKRSRKKAITSGFSLDLARKEASSWHRDHDRTLDHYLSERDRLIQRCRDITHDGKRESIHMLPPLWARISELEAALARMHHAVAEPYDPVSATVAYLGETA